MKKLGLIIFLVVLYTTTQCQVTWNITVKKIADKTYELHIKALVENSWHIYSQTSPKGGPLPTSISFSKNPLVILQGKLKEKGKSENYYDDIFGVDVRSYIDSVDFIQVIKLKTKVKTIQAGIIEYMACTKEQCLTPQKVKFSIKLD